MWRPRRSLDSAQRESTTRAMAVGITADVAITQQTVVLFVEKYGESAGKCRVVQMILSNLGVTQQDMAIFAFDALANGLEMKRQVSLLTGFTDLPLLFIQGRCVGNSETILHLSRVDGLRPKLIAAKVPGIVNAIPTTTLENNVYGYPKALTSGQTGSRAGTKMNVLLGACGSSAADKVPDLVEACVAKGWSVKLVTTRSGEHFYKSFGLQRIVDAIGSENIYKDEDEWNFEYEDFDMPVRACHLELRKWADVLVIAPITCNTMAKCVAGIGDTLLSAVLVAWQYHLKTAIFAPACNQDMWNNMPTQRNVAYIRKMGVEVVGPRISRLTNGQIGIGCMEFVDRIVERIDQEESALLSGSQWFMRRGKVAAAEDNMDLWRLVIRAIDDGHVPIESIAEENGDTLLHFAAGGENNITPGGKVDLGIPDFEAMKMLLDRKASPNAKNSHGFTPLHVAIASSNIDAVKLLIDHNADAKGTLIDFPNASEEINRLLLEKAPNADAVKTQYYFTYGSLKRGFPNFDANASHLQKFVDEGTTVSPLPLVIPNSMSCMNPNCPYLHRQANLCYVPGEGKRVKGEVFEVDASNIKALDKLEGFVGLNEDGSAYERHIVDVELSDGSIVSAYVYFAHSVDEMMSMVEYGTATFIDEYTIDMAKGQLKPSFLPENLKRTQSILNVTKSVRYLDVPRKKKETLRIDTIVEDHIGSIQQVINACSIAAISLSCQSLGLQLTIDEIFSGLRIPTNWVTEDGMTLSESFNTLVKLCSTGKDEALAPDLYPECFHLDKEVANYESFLVFLEASLGDSDDVIIANFSSKIARNSDIGGGHFSLVASYDSKDESVTIADVHPKKYGAKWVCPAKRLFDAMVDKDSALKRSRGFLRLVRRSGASYKSMDACRRAVCFSEPGIAIEHQSWLAKWGDLPLDGFDSAVNLCGLSSLALLLSGLAAGKNESGSSVQPLMRSHFEADELIWSLRLKVTKLLSQVTKPSEMLSYASRAFDVFGLALTANIEKVDTSSAEAITKWLSSRVGPETGAGALVLLDLNVAYGSTILDADPLSEEASLDYGSLHWCCIVMVEEETQSVIIADPKGKLMTKLWRCECAKLCEGIDAAKKSNNGGNLVIIKPR